MSKGKLGKEWRRKIGVGWQMGRCTVLKGGATVQRPCSEREHRETGNGKKGNCRCVGDGAMKQERAGTWSLF